ncbi:sensor histidine kinase [Actimicrobium sp. CCI2.3]|uniref:sensor histidine kinase n=1 Tax=Actimicrobium sp. CCI2.3 TaxID=3048616 RepID=UPI002AB4F737|nr:ATP-binding protein [Actimicrobium sp. CCI2.3]MDY7574823.1 ATP-binding protein [Actimicrobium sp. CCI2.3]MEB0020216.1 ATP-binding protein [Actimicrobium sp. CCI2.3]
MSDMHDTYYALFTEAVFNADPEEALIAAADFGRGLMTHGIAPEGLIEIHQQAVLRMATEHPALPLQQVAAPMMAPLMEATMAFSFAFRKQREAKDAMKDQLERAGRLEAIGTMAAGIAHDFNTIIGIINGYAELLIEDYPDSSNTMEYTQQIASASLRARDLVMRMLAFARESPIIPSTFDAVARVRDVLKMIRMTLPPAIKVTFHPELEVAYTLADPLQIEQIIMNLCINAADAMDGAGKLDLNVAPAPPLLRADGSSAPCFMLTIDDDGCGMPAEVLQRALDPFYTTKEPGKGSGLGLSVVYGIITDLGGQLTIHSEVGMGSSFRVILPLVCQTQLSAPPLARPPLH